MILCLCEWILAKENDQKLARFFIAMLIAKKDGKIKKGSAV